MILLIILLGVVALVGTGYNGNTLCTENVIKLNGSKNIVMRKRRRRMKGREKRVGLSRTIFVVSLNCNSKRCQREKRIALLRQMHPETCTQLRAPGDMHLPHASRIRIHRIRAHSSYKHTHSVHTFRRQSINTRSTHASFTRPRIPHIHSSHA